MRDYGIIFAIHYDENEMVLVEANCVGDAIEAALDIGSEYRREDIIEILTSEDLR